MFRLSRLARNLDSISPPGAKSSGDEGEERVYEVYEEARRVGPGVIDVRGQDAIGADAGFSTPHPRDRDDMASIPSPYYHCPCQYCTPFKQDSFNK